MDTNSAKKNGFTKLFNKLSIFKIFEFNKAAFTLAEALLTLLIISIVVALSTSMIAKKNKKLQANNMTHYWYCTRESTAGSHTQGSNYSPTPGSVSSNGCTFNPPPGVNKFNVTVIGGGGGGASGYATLDPEQIYSPGTYSFSPSSNAKYYIILVGGGGGGGGKRPACARYGDQGGRSGALIADYFDLNKNNTYEVVVGQAGAGASGTHTGGQAGDTTFKGGDLDLFAGGGGGGSRRPMLVVKCKNKGGGSPGSFSPNTVYGKNGNGTPSRDGAYILFNQDMSAQNSETADIAAKLPESYKSAGAGGMGDRTYGHSGQNGVAYIQRVSIYGGGGGQSGNSSFYQFKKSPGQTLVTIGKGGYGATTIDTNGENGGASRFGNKVIASGGLGGITRSASASGTSYDVTGENGYRSLMPLNIADEFTTSTIAQGGTATTAGENAVTPGAGGGGGGSNGQTAEWSAGGNGAPGIVLISW